MKTDRLVPDGLYLVACEPFSDKRGLFARFFCDRELASLIGGRRIVNINFSRNRRRGTVRGMHYQLPPAAEMKFIRCIRGRIFDVAIDVRRGSPTFLQWYGAELTAENLKMLCIPEGFAHGFQVLEDGSELLYLHTAFYSKEHERTVHYADPAVGIHWPAPVADVSGKDQAYPFIDAAFEGMAI
jgi:dTDP-4-dehydrorhamnose 3,5-epimerase